MYKASDYKRGDFRRILVVLVAIEDLKEPTLSNICERTGLDNQTVRTQLRRAQGQFGVKIGRDGVHYVIDCIGPVIRMTGARKALTGELGDVTQTEVPLPD